MSHLKLFTYVDTFVSHLILSCKVPGSFKRTREKVSYGERGWGRACILWVTTDNRIVGRIK